MSDDANQSGNVVPFARRERSKPNESSTRSGRTPKPQASKLQKPQVKQALLTGSSDWKTIRAFKGGQILPCRIVAREERGYAVETKREGLPGFLPSNSKHEVGDEIHATYVRVDQRRLLFSERFTSGGFKTD